MDKGKQIRIFLLFVLLVASVTSADGASYQKTDGTIVDPIKYGTLMGEADHPYAGDDLQPTAELSNVDLSYANLDSAALQHSDLSYANLYIVDLYTANLSGATLVGANLETVRLFGADVSGANFEGANLRSAQLIFTDFSNANLTNVDFRYAETYHVLLTGANLSGIKLDDSGQWGDSDWSESYYYSDNPPTWDSGMDAAWQAAAGISVLDPVPGVPEPGALLCILIGLLLLPCRLRRGRASPKA